MTSELVYTVEHAQTGLKTVPSRSELLSTPGILLHAYNRGVDRSQIFFRRSDYEYFITRMAESLRPSEVTLLAYTLMPNHFHMMVQQLIPYGLSRYVKNVCDGYAKFVNKFRRRSGHLFQGRYRPHEAHDPAAILRLSHYIHFNAVSAGLAKDPSEWMHSSYKDYAGLDAGGFVDIRLITELVGGRDKYLEFLGEYDPSDPAGLLKFLASAGGVSLSHDRLGG